MAYSPVIGAINVADFVSLTLLSMKIPTNRSTSGISKNTVNFAPADALNVFTFALKVYVSPFFKDTVLTPKASSQLVSLISKLVVSAILKVR